MRLAKLRWRIEHDYSELKQCLGLDHYEGRTYHGRHPPSHGGSLISLYQAQRDLQTALACWHGHCPTCQRRLPP